MRLPRRLGQRRKTRVYGGKHLLYLDLLLFLANSDQHAWQTQEYSNRDLECSRTFPWDKSCLVWTSGSCHDYSFLRWWHRVWVNRVEDFGIDSNYTINSMKHFYGRLREIDLLVPLSCLWQLRIYHDISCVANRINEGMPASITFNKELRISWRELSLNLIWESLLLCCRSRRVPWSRASILFYAVYGSDRYDWRQFWDWPRLLEALLDNEIIHNTNVSTLASYDRLRGMQNDTRT